MQSLPVVSPRGKPFLRPTRRRCIEIRTREIVSGIHAAQRLGVTKRRVIQLANEGKLAAILDSSGHRTYRAEDVASLKRQRETQRRRS
jgi:hypothetical protein